MGKTKTNYLQVAVTQIFKFSLLTPYKESIGFLQIEMD